MPESMSLERVLEGIGRREAGRCKPMQDQRRDRTRTMKTKWQILRLCMRAGVKMRCIESCRRVGTRLGAR